MIRLSRYIWRAFLGRHAKIPPGPKKHGWQIPVLLVLFLATTSSVTPAKAAGIDPLVSAWNRACQSLRAPQKFYLAGEITASKEATIRALTDFCAIMSQKEKASCADEIAAHASEMAKSAFLAYAGFRNAHWQDKAIVLSPQMSARELAQSLNSYLKINVNGRVPDYVSRETVATIIWMNNFCAFFEANLAKMHRQGIDFGLNSCQRLSTKGKYPCLDGWLK